MGGSLTCTLENVGLLPTCGGAPYLDVTEVP